MPKKYLTILLLVMTFLLGSSSAFAHGWGTYAYLYLGYSGYYSPFSYFPRSYFTYFPRESNPNLPLMENIRALGEERRAMWVTAKREQAAELKAAAPNPPADSLVAPEIKTEQKKEY